ncbi:MULTISPECIES: AraC family transcriptional regulator [Microbacterium]|jgi:AraC-like DNA-binding protein|uniref:AraC family transcriptional regulator n=1 Tax=Microbacterium TaxID=33882 RepID=UPI0022608345|nr:helix-turn-helix domain-containing protein [Microbacterium testaceum]
MDGIPAASRGVLYPTRLPTFHREPAEGDVATFVRWFWIPEWDLEPGRTSRQHLIGFPAVNLVIENGTVGIAGPTTRSSVRDLTGTGWAVGALLRPAATPAIVEHVGLIRDRYDEVDLPDLAAAVGSAMNTDAPSSQRRRAAIAAVTDWLLHRLDAPTDEALLANRMLETAETDREVRTVGDLAARLRVSTRSLQRLAATYVGVPPSALIRRRRLQEAAERIRQDPGLDLTRLAHEYGYADHAHLTNDFRTALGFTPSGYRHALPRVQTGNRSGASDGSGRHSPTSTVSRQGRTRAVR